MPECSKFKINSIVQRTDSAEFDLTTIKWLLCLCCLSCTTLLQAEARQWPASLVLPYRQQAITFSLLDERQGSPVYGHPLLKHHGLLLSNRLLVKHAPSVALDSIALLQGLDAVEVFATQQAQWHLVLTTGPQQTLLLYQQLQRHPNILAVEPDVLQIRVSRDGNYDAEIWQLQAPASVRHALNIAQWPDFAGRGVTIAVVDHGFRLQDPSLNHMPLKLHYDIAQLRALPSQRAQLSALIPDGTHGDSVVSVLWSRHPDFMGLAPYADAVLLQRSLNWTSDILIAFYMAKIAGAAVVECAWTLPFTPQSLTDALVDLTQSGRQGLGVAIVVSAGNQMMSLDHGFTLANQAEVIAVNGFSGNRVWPVTGRNIVTAVPVPYLTYQEAADDYRGIFSGTSAAAAALSGIIAVQLALQPELTLVQLKSALQRHTHTVLDVNALFDLRK